jgi:cation/acetate symporter
MIASILVTFATFALYIGISYYNRAKGTADFYVASRGVKPIYNGMAIGGDWMSAASFIGMAGSVMLLGYNGLAFIMGWTAGYLLLTFLMAPQLRKYGRFTVPEFIGDKFNSNPARLVAAILTILISYIYVLGQLTGSGVVIGRILSVDAKTGTMIGVVIIAIYATLGGMKGITWTQVAQYIILIIAYIIPIVFMSLTITGSPLPWITYGNVIGQMGQMADGTHYHVQGLMDEFQVMDAEYFGIAEYIGTADKLQFTALMTSLIVGTAGLPHVIVRFFTVSTMKAARWSGAWALLFIGLLYLSAPAYAAFARFNLMTQIVGKRPEDLPAWSQTWIDTGRLDLVTNADGIITWDGLTVSADIVVLATPDVANLGMFVIALVAAGAMAAALSTAGGLLITISSSFAHDIYYRLMNPQASDKKRLTAGRIAIVAATVLAGLSALNPPGLITQVIAWAFGLAAASFFPVLLLGIWWKRMNATGALAGMIAGATACLGYIFLASNDIFQIITINDTGAGFVGLPFGILGCIIGSLMTAAPTQHQVDETINLRYPEQMTYKDGEVWMDSGK